jgi:signal transduction histidine kinase/ligand-binding sensor domain-containing protein/CheY-like chemotaxis protein
MSLLVIGSHILTNNEKSAQRRISLGFIFLFVYFLNGNAQVPELRFRYLSKEEGLHNLNVNHVTQDSTGFIWIASNNGLYKYDGYDLKGYYSNQSDRNSLSNNNISYLYTDSKGNLWVGTLPGLCKYNPDLDNFERCDDLNRFSDMIDKNVNQVSEDNKGNILISCNNYILKYHEAEKKFSTLLSIKNGDIKHFIVDKSNTIWLACSNHQGLKKYNINTGKWELPMPPGNDYKELSSSNISYISLNNNKLWIATMGDGIKMLDVQSKEYTRYPYEKGDASMAFYTFIDNKKNIWAVDFTGLKLLDKQSGTFIGYYPKLNDPKSIRDQVKGIFQDKQGNYWVYNGPKGIGISLALKGFRYFNSDITNFWHTSSENIVAVQEDSHGNLWIGHAAGGISVFNYHKHAIINYRPNEHDAFSLGKGEIGCIFLDSQGTLWICSYTGGLQYFDEQSGKFIGYKHNPDDSNSIAGNDIRSIAEDKEGNLWLAVHGKGVDKFDRKNAKFVHYNSSLNKLSKDWTYDLLFDYKGDLWVATSWGLCYLKKGEKSFKSYYAEANDTNSLSNSFINTIYEDNEHVLWIGTSNGLNRYDREKDKFRQYGNIFNDNNISSILSDKDKNLWISNLSGLAMLDVKNNRVKNFALIDGLIADEFNPRSCFKSQNDEFFFGGTKGIVIFKPHELSYNKAAPFVFIDKIKILNKEIKTSDPGHYLQKQICRTDKITLLYSDKIITLKYKALNFINPESNQYACMLEGFDKKWNFVGTIREATYTNLDPGTYTFRVKASNNDGYWNNDGASLVIIILPPWWKTLWFRSLLVVLVLSLFYSFYYVRLSLYRIQEKKLNKLVAERTKDLEETTTQLEERQEEINQQNEELVAQHERLVQTNDYLQQKKLKIEEQNKELDKHRNELELIVEERTRQLIMAKEKAEESDRLKSSFLANLSHEIRTPLNAILGFSGLIADENLSSQEKLRFSQFINSSGDSLLNLINDMIDLSKIEAGQVDIYIKEVKLMGIFNELSEVFKVQLSKLQHEVVKKLILQINVDKELMDLAVKTDPLRLKQILTNLMSNAIKFTNQGFIELGCHPRCNTDTTDPIARVTSEPVVEASELLFYVKDTGIGISKENLNIIFGRFRKIEEDKNNLYRGTGLGLAISEQLVNLLGGQIWVESELHVGTTFYFTHPFIKADRKLQSPLVNKNLVHTLSTLKGITILVAEDDYANFMYIEELLNNSEATVLHAANGKQAVSMAKNDPSIKLILMDIKMPEMDGIEAFHAIRALGINTPIIAQTAYAFSDDVEKILKNGFDDYISKPIREDLLLASINKMLNKIHKDGML